MICVYLGCLAVTAEFTMPLVSVNESEGMVQICVEKSHQTIGDVTLDLQSRDGSASGNTFAIC